eukprot:TRINITY_DN20284_c0_g2_i4.p1 TRINITY_DN20284_c0_g2~~TRINITY_DN20284_c0_g2_i4.p1  ORF type:complete len:119 (-),score=19.83 TRINITY_DN20284_c0_g2_i4:574-930(-)
MKIHKTTRPLCKLGTLITSKHSTHFIHSVFTVTGREEPFSSSFLSISFSFLFPFARRDRCLEFGERQLGVLSSPSPPHSLFSRTHFFSNSKLGFLAKVRIKPLSFYVFELKWSQETLG